jgi:thiamine-monophosphate kinase
MLPGPMRLRQGWPTRCAISVRRCWEAIGRAAPGGAPSRGGARAGDELWVSGHIGDAGLGLLIRQGKLEGGSDSLAYAYTHPQPNVALGQDLAPLVRAMADVSDGLLIDAQRIAEASGVGIDLALDAVPLSDGWCAVRGAGVDDRISATTMGDDYGLLFAAAPGAATAIEAAGARHGAVLTRIGRCTAEPGLRLDFAGKRIERPTRLGYIHGN